LLQIFNEKFLPCGAYTMQMHIAVYDTAWCLSVCMSIMCHYCIKMAKPMIKD